MAHVMPHHLTIRPGSSLDLRIAVGVGPIVDTIGGSLTADSCLKAGDRVIVCACEKSCNPLGAGQCYTIGTDLTVYPTLPAGKARLIKAADLRGFALVLRIGSGCERYLSTGATCKDSDRAVVKGCHEAEVGDLLTIPGGVAATEIKAVLPGDSDGQAYTVFITVEGGEADVPLSAGAIASIQEPQLQFDSRVSACGIAQMLMSPSDTRQLPSGRVLPFTLMLERSWDYTAFNRVHGTACAPEASWAHELVSGTAEIL